MSHVVELLEPSDFEACPKCGDQRWRSYPETRTLVYLPQVQDYVVCR
jgi:hypothetical protein